MRILSESDAASSTNTQAAVATTTTARTRGVKRRSERKEKDSPFELRVESRCSLPWVAELLRCYALCAVRTCFVACFSSISLLVAEESEASSRRVGVGGSGGVGPYFKVH